MTQSSVSLPSKPTWMPLANKILIAGPCAAETEQQVLETAQALASFCPIFRAGIWKPRTSPDSFQGIGAEGLGWLQHVKEQTGMLTATEVATPEHIRLALEAGVDYLWIGARTAANPIQVQLLADALAQSAIKPKAVLIKNPVNEDAALWIGNIERLLQASVEVMAVHRGCNHRPCWAMAFEVKRRMPHIPLLLDPSHMSGDAGLIASLSQQAMDLDYDGLMIESHCSPMEALSDAKQQITPVALQAIISHLVLRHASSPDSTLLALRQQIDEIDDELWNLIARRMHIAQQIGDYKRSLQMPVLQVSRYDAILQKRKQWARDNRLSEDLVQQIFDVIHKESVKVQL